MKPVAALDMGTSNVKAGLLDREGRLTRFLSRPSPRAGGEGLLCEADAEDYLNTCREILSDLSAGLAPGTPLGIACQRSSFLLWNSGTGKPETPLISWRDRRGEAWCQRHAAHRSLIKKITGLPLSPHYLGPKLVACLEEDTSRKKRLAQGEILAGTLDTFLLWSLAKERRYESDLSMASRTLLADIRAGDWSRPLLELFGLDARTLPAIVPTGNRNIPIAGGFTVAGTMADQAACALAALGEESGQVLVNVGTGIFVLRPTGKEAVSLPNYCTGVLLKGNGSDTLYALEGTINGIGPATVPLAQTEPDLPDRDPAPDTFCIPDSSGAGSPHWRADVSCVFSQDMSSQEPLSVKRICWEGAVFRVREILEDLFPEGPPGAIVLSAGLAGASGLGKWLASCLGREVFFIPEPEQTLLGAARLARGNSPRARPPRIRCLPERRGRYLPGKYARWKVWLKTVLESPTES